MSGFVAVPNLPVNTNSVLIGEKYAGLFAKSLEILNISLQYIPANPHVDPRLSSHADLSAVHGGGERLFLAPHLKGSDLEQKLRSYKADIIFPPFKQCPEYPYDAQLNVCSVGEHLIYCERSAHKQIADHFLQEREMNAVSVRQGYSRCAVCIVDANAIITSDAGIKKAASDAGMDVLLIKPGFIELDGFDYGFIGGAGFKISTDKLAFTGTLTLHPDREKILDFLKKHKVEPIFLTNRPIFDIGGAIPFIEK